MSFTPGPPPLSLQGNLGLKDPRNFILPPCRPLPTLVQSFWKETGNPGVASRISSHVCTGCEEEFPMFFCANKPHISNPPDSPKEGFLCKLLHTSGERERLWRQSPSQLAACPSGALQSRSLLPGSVWGCNLASRGSGYTAWRKVSCITHLPCAVL